MLTIESIIDLQYQYIFSEILGEQSDNLPTKENKKRQIFQNLICSQK